MSRSLRADAARNAERIVSAARAVYAERGPDAAAEEIARRAGVGLRTLYRRFPTKGDLARAALDHSIGEHIAPVLDRALNSADSRQGLIDVIDAALTLAARDHHVLAAAQAAGSLTSDVYTPFYDSLAVVMRRAQSEGAVRADLHPEDLPRLLVMLVSVLLTMDPGSGGWRRYLDLLVDSLSPAAATPLAPLVPTVELPPEGPLGRLIPETG